MLFVKLALLQYFAYFLCWQSISILWKRSNWMKIWILFFSRQHAVSISEQMNFAPSRKIHELGNRLSVRKILLLWSIWVKSFSLCFSFFIFLVRDLKAHRPAFNAEPEHSAIFPLYDDSLQVIFTIWGQPNSYCIARLWNSRSSSITNRELETDLSSISYNGRTL